MKKPAISKTPKNGSELPPEGTGGFWSPKEIEKRKQGAGGVAVVARLDAVVARLDNGNGHKPNSSPPPSADDEKAFPSLKC